jgi:hypothetical protein
MSKAWADLGGSVYVNPELSKENRLLSDYMLPLADLVEPAGEFNIGKNSGDRVSMRVTGRISGTADAALLEFQKIPLSKPPEYDVTAQVYRRGMGIAWTGVREDLDRLNVKDSNVKVLREHYNRTRNKVINDVLVAGRSFCYTALTASTANFTTNGTPTGTAAIAFSLWHAHNLNKFCRKYNIAPADGDTYVFVVSPTVEANILQDSGANGFVDVKKYIPGGAADALHGEIGRIGRLRVVVENKDITDGIGTGSAFGSGFVLGYGACRQVLGPYDMHLRVNMNIGHDFGNQNGIAWQSFEGYKVPLNYTTHGEGAVIHYTTA